MRQRRQARRNYRKRIRTGGDKTVRRIEEALVSAIHEARNTEKTGIPSANVCELAALHSLKGSKPRATEMIATRGAGWRRRISERNIGEAGLKVSFYTPVLRNDKDFSVQEVLYRPREIAREVNPDHPTKRIVGFLGLGAGHPVGHTIGVIPRDALPRDIRRKLGRRRHLVIDTGHRDGYQIVTPREIANILTNNGRTEGAIVALTKKTKR